MTQAQQTAEEKAAAAEAKKAAAEAKKAAAAEAKKAAAEAEKAAAAEAKNSEVAENTITNDVAGDGGADTKEKTPVENSGNVLVNADLEQEKQASEGAKSIAEDLNTQDASQTGETHTANHQVELIKRKKLRVTNVGSSQLRCFVTDVIIPALGHVDIEYDTAKELKRAKDSFDKVNKISASQRLSYEDLGEG